MFRPVPLLACALALLSLCLLMGCAAAPSSPPPASPNASNLTSAPTPPNPSAPAPASKPPAPTPADNSTSPGMNMSPSGPDGSSGSANPSSNTAANLSADPTLPDVSALPPRPSYAPLNATVGPFVRPALGPANASVEIIAFEDFECPFCQLSYPGEKMLVQAYPEQVRLIYMHFPLEFHPHAQKAAEAAECAREQGKFWEYHDRLFDTARLDAADLLSHATALGLDPDRFRVCLSSGRMAEAVKAQSDYGASLGVSGTPTYFINGEKSAGAKGFYEFESLVRAKLNLSARPPVASAPAPPPAPPASIEDRPTRGVASAPLLVVEYSDFMCPFCQQMQGRLNKLLTDYSGRIKLAYMHFPVHTGADKLGEAAECAADQGQFWEMHDFLFANTTSSDLGNPASAPTIKAQARALGMDGARFDSCFDSGEKADVIRSHVAAGRAIGVRGTPTYVIGNTPHLGVMDYPALKKLVDNALMNLSR